LLSENDEADVYYRTQYGILKSRSLAATVIREEGLDAANLSAAKPKTGLLAAVWSKVSEQFSDPPQPSPRPASTDAAIKSQLVDNYLQNLEVPPTQGTRPVKVGFSSTNPELSAKIANAHCLAYIRQGLGLYADASGEAQHYLDRKLVELRERVEQSEIALN